MNRRSFVLSWGRKIFFGFSWPLTCVIGLVYLKSYILPLSGSDLLYFVTTHIGHFGLLNALLYFLLYAPVVSIMPTYYISRLWSLILILILNLAVLADGLIFSSYHVHSYGFIMKLLIDGGFKQIDATSSMAILVPSVGLLTTIVLWIRGELIWRWMQRRFSNPVKNWYLVFIVLCIMASKLIYHFTPVSPKLASLFPLNFHPDRKNESSIISTHRLYYPKTTIDCLKKGNQNILMIVLNKWNSDEFNEESMPNAWAMKKHGVEFKTHYATSVNPELGGFAFYYSIPGHNIEALGRHKSAAVQEMIKRQYEIVTFDNDEKLIDWVSERRTELDKPFYANLFIQDLALADSQIQNTINNFATYNALDNTNIVITGLSSRSLTQITPLLYISTERKASVVEHVTSHYDVMPTLMEYVWGCKKTYYAASSGKSLFESGQESLFMSQKNDFYVMDFKRDSMISFENGKLHLPKSTQKELVFDALKTRTLFNRPK